ncbi:hypothetical protein [Paraburkholderia sediminicola]|uniref:hypothetical protein n=1 Tax=Paraburkholderia sediminicola TaxID=458836 RepID=UPI0038BCC356
MKQNAIKDAHSLNAYLKSEDSVLGGCPPDVIDRLQKSLRFEEGRVVHGEYGLLLAYKSIDEVIQLLSFMGLPESKFEVIRDSGCVNGVCFPQPGVFCDTDYCRK